LETKAGTGPRRAYDRRALRFRLLIWLALLPVAAAACGGSGGGGGGTSPTPPASANPKPNVLEIVAGSEQQKVLDEVVVPWCRKHGLTCNYTLLGSVDQARLLASGNAPYDAFWFASSVFEQLGDTSNQLRDVQPMFTTPVVFAGWRSEMQRLGLTGPNVTIGDILRVVTSGKTTVWATNPTQSNSGATALFAFLDYFAGNKPGQQLTLAQLNEPKVKRGITRFIRSIARTPPSTGTMMDDCIANDKVCKTMFTYEDLVIEKNQELEKAGHEPLYMVYPRGSLAISDAPLGFLPHGDNPAKEANFKALQAYLLSAEAQQKVEAFGRRPYTSIGVSLPGADPKVFNPAWGVEETVKEQTITYPTADVIERVLANYQLAYRRPVNVAYCLDGSGSMDSNGGWNGVEQSVKILFDPATAAKYLLQISPRDRTTVLVFSDGIDFHQTVDGNGAADLATLRGHLGDEKPGGGTAIYSCLQEATNELARPAGDTRKKLIVLMTDGQNNAGLDHVPDNLRAADIPVIAIAYGSDADTGTLKDIAAQTGGSFIASSDLVQALRSATAYK
jgi:Ca-activated chloride channel family protein